jgi:hypothetical protein
MEQAQGLDGNLVTLPVYRGIGLNLNFIPTGETIKKAWLDDPSRIAVSFDGNLCEALQGQGCANNGGSGATVVHLRQITKINFAALPSSGSGHTLLTVITEGGTGISDGRSGRKLYQFLVVPVSSRPAFTTVSIQGGSANSWSDDGWSSARANAPLPNLSRAQTNNRQFTAQASTSIVPTQPSPTVQPTPTTHAPTIDPTQPTAVTQPTASPDQTTANAQAPTPVETPAVTQLKTVGHSQQVSQPQDSSAPSPGQRSSPDDGSSGSPDTDTASTADRITNLSLTSPIEDEDKRAPNTANNVPSSSGSKGSGGWGVVPHVPSSQMAAKSKPTGGSGAESLQKPVQLTPKATSNVPSSPDTPNLQPDSTNKTTKSEVDGDSGSVLSSASQSTPAADNSQSAADDQLRQSVPTPDAVKPPTTHVAKSNQDATPPNSTTKQVADNTKATELALQNCPTVQEPASQPEKPTGSASQPLTEPEQKTAANSTPIQPGTSSRQQSLADADAVTRGLLAAKLKKDQEFQRYSSNWEKAQRAIVFLRQGKTRESAAKLARLQLEKLNRLISLGQKSSLTWQSLAQD